MSDRHRNAFILALVIGLIAASAIVIGGFPGVANPKRTELGLDLKGGVQLVYQGEPTPQTPHVTPAALSRAVDVMRQRTNQLGVSETQIQTSGGNQITVGLPDVQNTARAEALVGSTAQLEFYDWEANVLTPSGKPVASLLQSQDQNALLISQGSGGGGPGSSTAGAMQLYQAVKLASRQPQQTSSQNSRKGSEAFLFGKPGSPACTVAARDYHVAPVVGQYCYLAGPAAPASTLSASLPSGISVSQGQELVVPQGWVVLQAVPTNFNHEPRWSDPNPDFFVLHDQVALRGTDITNPQQTTDNVGNPDVSFGF
ncbi:MAG TPA: hypothetical protein VE983_04365, partial [Solirubrobacteraceae bacterium]|nr:hypothetical protein [Solirubrobacteraceae bacterium]